MPYPSHHASVRARMRLPFLFLVGLSIGPSACRMVAKDESAVLALTSQQGNTGSAGLTEGEKEWSQESFLKTVYPYSIQNCYSCHGDQASAPFAHSNVEVAYSQTLSRIDADHIPRSKFVIYGTNGHCGNSRCDSTRKAELVSLVERWRLPIGRPSVPASETPIPSSSVTPLPSAIPLPSPTPLPPATSAPSAPFGRALTLFRSTVKQTLLNSCSACHYSTSGRNFLIVASENELRNNALLQVSDWSKPAQSTLIRKGTGVGHGGGKILSPAQVAAWSAWIQEETATPSNLQLAGTTQRVPPQACGSILVSVDRVLKPGTSIQGLRLMGNGMGFFSDTACTAAWGARNLAGAQPEAIVYFKRNPVSTITSSSIVAQAAGAASSPPLPVSFSVAPPPGSSTPAALPLLGPKGPNTLPNTLASSLSRSTAPVTYIRLLALFPDSGPALASILLGTYGADVAFTQTDRPVSAMGQSALRDKVSMLCSLPDSSSNLVFSTSRILMPGEVPPSDPAIRLAFAAARNVWLYPYAAKDDEVLRLRDLYHQVRNVGGSEAEAKKAVCMGALLAFQFWVGNQGAADAIRRVALDLGGRLPTFAEFHDYLTRKMTLSAYVRKIQNEPGFIEVVKYWHRNWLGISKVFNIPSNATTLIDPRFISEITAPKLSGGFSSIAGVNFELLPSTARNQPDTIRFRFKEYPGLQGQFDGSETCQDVDQNFDPRTHRIVWQHRNPVSRAWETVGAYFRGANGWVLQNGSITLKNGAKKSTSLRDIIVAHKIEGDEDYYYYDRRQQSALHDTPLEKFLPGDRRVLRYSPSGLQSGYSRVKLLFSDQEVRVCNSVSRFLATCAFRPPKNDRTAAAVGSITLKGVVWTAASAGPLDLLRPDSAFHPAVLDHFRCGNPNVSALDGNPAAIGYEDLAFPLGYSDFTSGVAPHSAYLNDLAYNARILTPEGTEEFEALRQIYEDLDEEPYHLIEDIVKNNRDYRLLLTAPYTFGRNPLDFFYHLNALHLPAPPPGQYVAPGARGYLSETAPHQIRMNTFAPIPANWVRNSRGTLMNRSPAAVALNAFKITEFQPKSISGILTQPAFVGSTSPKVRTLSARFFSRLLCGEPSSIGLSGAQEVLHSRYIPTHEASGAEHIQQPCRACHINLDPLASGLSASFFRNSGRNPMDGAGESLPIWGPSGDLGFFGIQSGGPKGDGAFLGRRVTLGIRQIGQILGDSVDFARCTVKTAFQNIYGREPTPSELTEIILPVTNRFMSTHNYKLMIEDLVSDEASSSRPVKRPVYPGGN